MGTPGPAPTHTPGDALGVFLRLDDPGTPLTASEVATELGCSRRTAFDKLETLVERGDLKSKKTGARGRVWWRPGEHDRGDADLFEEVLGTAPVAIAIIDSAGDLVRANGRAMELLGDVDGDPREHRVGEPAVYDEDGRVLPPGDRPSGRALRTGEPVIGEHVRVTDADGERVWLSVNAVPVEGADGDVERVILAGEEITRVKEQARRLERRRDELEAELEEVFERVTDAFLALDGEWRFTHVNERAEELIGRSEEEVLGERIWDEFPEAVEGVVWDRLHEAMETQEPVSFELFYDPLEVWAEVTAYPSGTGLSVYFRDVTERKERERELEASEERYRSLAETATDAILTVDADRTVRFANEAVEDVFGYAPGQLVGESLTTLIPERYPNLREEGIERLLERGEGPTARSNVEIPGERRDGREIDLQVSLSEFALDGDRRFTVIARDVTERKEREHELEARREQLATLNRLETAVRDITHAVMESSSREAVEELLCERLAGTPTFRFAWTGSVSPASGRLRVRTGAGVDDPLDDPPDDVDVGPGDDRPTRRAARTGEMCVARELGDRPVDGWVERALEHGARSVAAIPIEYDGTRYGVLTVGSGRPGAFGETERAVVGQLGEVVGHALTALERKRALTTETVVELRLRVAGLFDEADGLAEEHVTFDRTVPVGEQTFLKYGTTSGEAAETLRPLVERLPQVRNVRVLEEDADDTRFELTITEPSVTAAVASNGGRVESAAIEDGDYELLVRLPSGSDVRGFVEDVRSVYPDTAVVARRQTTRTGRPVRRVHEALNESLTERQRAALETAVFAGYFEWPRRSSGVEVAESLGISASTFHQHVREAERKLMGALFADDGARGG